MECKDIYDCLTEEQKHSLKNCKNKEEMTDLLLAEGIELTDEQLESIAGGELSNCIPKTPYYIIPPP